MLVCICNAIREDELQEAAQLGFDDAETAYAWLGKQPDCRICLEHADDVLLEARQCGGKSGGGHTLPAGCPGLRAAQRIEAEIRAG